MTKIRIINKLLSENVNIEKEIIGIKNNNTLKFQDDDVFVTLTIFNNKIEMIRKSLEYTVKMHFEKNNSTCTCTTKEICVDLEIETLFLDILHNHILIEYILKNEKNVKFTYSITYFLI